MVSLATAANDQLISRLIFTGALANLPVNLVMLGNLLFGRMPPFAVATMLIGTIGQSTGPLIVVALLTAISASFYRSDGLLYKAQLTMVTSTVIYDNEHSNFSMSKQNSKNESCVKPGQKLKLNQRFYQNKVTLLTKLHLAVFYETVCTKDKFCFTFGPYTKISHKSVSEFAFVYSGFILYVAKMVKSGRL